MNQFINFFWTILCFTAVLIYWFSGGLSTSFYIFIAISLVPTFIPQKIFDKLQLSYDTRFYERLGVRFIRRFVQHGDIANRITRKGNPAYQVISRKTNPDAYLKTIIMYERFHWMCFVFFLLTSMEALIESRYLIALIITISNVIYNCCPILLQQFNRVRILRLTKTI
jgi:hypothetical protein